MIPIQGSGNILNRTFVSFAVLLMLASTSNFYADDGIRFVSPDGLFKPRTFTQIALAGGDRIIFVSGQTARDETAQIVGVGDTQKQTEKVIESLRVAVEPVGGSMAHIAKIRTYTINFHPDDRLWIGKMARKKPLNPPAHTLIGISALAAPGLLVEIDAIAILD